MLFAIIAGAIAYCAVGAVGGAHMDEIDRKLDELSFPKE
jgi:hypothetical protein